MTTLQPIFADSPKPTASSGIDSPPTSFEQSLAAFSRSLEGKNRSRATIRAYLTDLTAFVAWLRQNNIIATDPSRVQRSDITEYLAFLAGQGLMGVSRARKISAIRELFKFLEGHDLIEKNPTLGVDTPKKEKGSRVYLSPPEYRAMLAQAGANNRDFAILQLFLQTGVRVSELCDLRLSDIDLGEKVLRVHGKGMVERQIELEKKGLDALKNYLKSRPQSADDHLFLTKEGLPLGKRSIQKLVKKYKEKAGITKRVTPHSLRHSFASFKAEQGVSPFQLQRWLGHANLNTTQLYVHLGRANAKRLMEGTSL